VKITHRELEGCLQGPRRWLLQKRSEQPHGFKIGYDRVLLLSIYRFHKTNSPVDARRYLAGAIKRHNFQDATRLDAIQLKLESYLTWVKSSSVRVADSKVRLSLESGFVTLVGEISRLDVTERSYRAVLLVTRIPYGWQEQLRMPLIQSAVSNQFGRPLEEVEVGMQRLDGSDLQTVSFSETMVANAKRRLTKLSKELEKLTSQA